MTDMRKEIEDELKDIVRTFMLDLLPVVVNRTKKGILTIRCAREPKMVFDEYERIILALITKAELAARIDEEELMMQNFVRQILNRKLAEGQVISSAKLERTVRQMCDRRLAELKQQQELV